MTSYNIKYINKREKYQDEIDFDLLDKLDKGEIEKEIIEWEKINKKKYTFNEAIKFGNIEHFKWLKENGCSFNIDTFNDAVLNGNLEYMKWLKDILYCDDEEFEEEVFRNAVENGNLENIKWLKENGCPNYY